MLLFASLHAARSYYCGHYFKDLKSNDILYESASGIGMNLYMTLEILQQVSGITNITIYGNDYVSRSVQISNDIFSNDGKRDDHLLPSSFGQLGSICEADSTQLDFVPSNSFDLVYTGYISPLFDPLHLNQSTTDETFVQYNAYCEQQQQQQQQKDTVDATLQINQTTTLSLAEQAQQIQNDWYGKWVGEMIRIAKPGAPIIVEQVSYPYVCSIVFVVVVDYNCLMNDFLAHINISVVIPSLLHLKIVAFVMQYLIGEVSHQIFGNMQ